MSADSKTLRHIAISGAGTGIGRAIALRLADAGTKLSLFARRAEPLEQTARLCRERNAAGVITQACDIAVREQVERSFEAFVHKHGPLTALVANAGIAGPNPHGPPGTQDRFQELVATNLLGTYFCLRAAQRRLAAGPAERHLVVIGSVLARIGVPEYSGYCASKAGLLGLVRSLAAELAPEGVRVNAVCPGWVETEMAWQGIDGMAKGMGIPREAALAKAMERVPQGRMGTPEEVAGAVAWLLSPDARGMCGQALDLNGGAFMH
jgi:ketoreductase